MTGPTRRLTDRTANVLGEPLALAVRVRQAPQQRSPRPGDTAVDDAIQEMSPSAFPVFGLPIVPILRSLKWTVTDLFNRGDVVKGVLAFTRSGDRVLVGRSRLRSLRPTEVIRRLSGGGPISVDLALLYEELIPELEVDGERFLVNAVDFGVLAKAVVTGELDAPKLAEQLGPYYDRVQALATHDPRSIRSLVRDQGPTT